MTKGRYSYLSRFIEVSGVSLHYLEWETDGPPVVIVHGNSHAGGVFAPLGERLSDAFHLYAIDMRGHGLSDKPYDPRDYTMPALVGDLLVVLDTYLLDTVLYAGYSLGGRGLSFSGCNSTSCHTFFLVK